MAVMRRHFVLAVASAALAGVVAGGVAGVVSAKMFSVPGPVGPTGPAGVAGPAGPAGPEGRAPTLSRSDVTGALAGALVLAEGSCPAGSRQIDRIPASAMLDFQIKNAVDDALRAANGVTGTVERSITTDGGTLSYAVCRF